MTYYEREENAEKEEKNTEHSVLHAESKKESKPEGGHHYKNELNNFQKFMAAAMIIQTLLLLFVAYKISNLTAQNSLGIPGDELNNLPERPSPRVNAPVIDENKLIDDDAIKGDENAPVTIVEFSDYECPFCQRFWEQTLPQIEEKYIKTGKVKLIYRDFPLGFHANAQKAAEAAECSGEQGKYYEMHDKLFAEGVSGGVSAFKQYAADLKLDTKTFNECLDAGKMRAEIQKDSADGQSLGVSGTPAFFINGKEVVGAQPFSVFEQIIEAELERMNQ